MSTSPSRLSRLKTRPEFLRVARGRRHAAPGLVLQAKQRLSDTSDCAPARTEARVGFTATKKTGNAVARNRIKRRLRAAAQSVLPAEARPGFDYVLVGRAATISRSWQSLLDDLGHALHMVHQPQAKRSDGRRASHPKDGGAKSRQPNRPGNRNDRSS